MATQAQRPIGLTQKSGDNTITGAGLAFFDVTLTGVSNGMLAEEFLTIANGWQAAGKGLGATTGDPVLTIGRELTRIETNDLHMDVVGMFDSRSANTVSLGFTLQELASDEAWERVLSTTFTDPEDDSMRVGTVVRPEHYKNIAYVNMANNGDLLLFLVMNAIQTNQAVITFSNTIGTPANVPVVFTATLASLEEIQSGVLPFKRFKFPFQAASGGLAAPLSATTAQKAGYSKKGADD
jgi:hypothetical protein